jgi:exonuclease III
MTSGGEPRKKTRHGPKKVLQSCDEFTIVNYNVRGINTIEKQQKVYEILGRYRPQVVCLNETKLQSPLYLDRYWSFQTNAQRHGGCWTASLTNAKLSLVKTMGTHLCWTQLEIGKHTIQILNCYVQPGEQQELKDRARRIVDIAKDIVKQDPHAPVIVCGDFNNHIAVVCESLSHCAFTPAIVCGTETHRQGGHLDQVFTRNIDVVNAIVSSDYDNEISDHKCLKVTLRPKQH